MRLAGQHVMKATMPGMRALCPSHLATFLAVNLLVVFQWPFDVMDVFGVVAPENGADKRSTNRNQNKNINRRRQSLFMSVFESFRNYFFVEMCHGLTN